MLIKLYLGGHTVNKGLDLFFMVLGFIILLTVFIAATGGELYSYESATIPISIMGSVFFLAGYIGYSLKVSK